LPRILILVPMVSLNSVKTLREWDSWDHSHKFALSQSFIETATILWECLSHLIMFAIELLMIPYMHWQWMEN
jgi:hypothetical protein